MTAIACIFYFKNLLENSEELQTTIVAGGRRGKKKEKKKKKKKFRDCACGLRSRRESDHRGEGGQAQRKKQKCTQSKHCCGSGHGRASLGKGS